MLEQLHYYIETQLINHQGVELINWKKLIKIQKHNETPQDSRQMSSMVMNYTFKALATSWTWLVERPSPLWRILSENQTD